MDSDLRTGLPAAVTEYLAASELADADAVVACFTPDALVVDEQREWRGAEAIRQWRHRVATAYEYTVAVSGAKALPVADGRERYEVYTHLEGNFPGGEIALTDHFTLRDGRIARLEIAPTVAAP
jgi:ketosteroid isomerase-like protein